MNKGLAHILLSLIGNIPFIDLYGGVVTIVEKLYNNKVSRFPASCDVINYSNCTIEKGLTPLTPDSQRRGILYFEDYGVTHNGSSSGFQNYTSKLRLVCWINTNLIEGNECNEFAMPIMSTVINKLTGKKYFNQNSYNKINITVTNIPIANEQLFNKYTYDSVQSQYLMPPYEYFALDLSISFAISPTCINSITVKERESC